MPRTVVFDIGNVLIRWEPEVLYSRLIPDAAARAAFFAETGLIDWNLEQDRGRPWGEAEAALIALHPQHAALIRAFRADWHEMVPGAIAENVAVLADIRARGIPNYAITNFAADTFREAQKRFPFLAEGFHGIVVSADERLVKPDPAIFELFLHRYGQRAADCLFIDDSAKNIAAAAALGFATIHVTPGIDLRQEVRRHGFPV